MTPREFRQEQEFEFDQRTLNDFFSYLDGLGDKFDSNSLDGHKRDWLKSFNDC